MADEQAYQYPEPKPKTLAELKRYITVTMPLTLVHHNWPGDNGQETRTPLRVQSVSSTKVVFAPFDTRNAELHSPFRKAAEYRLTPTAYILIDPLTGDEQCRYEYTAR